MEIALAVCAGIVVIELVWLMLLWRQNVLLRRQLIFIREKDSSMRVSVNLELLGNLKLAEEMNRILDDVRNRKSELVKREKLIANAYANLSHDIRTPLTSLDGYVQLLNEAETDEDRDRYSKIIRERIDTLKELLEDLFTYTKLKNDAYEIELSRLSLRTIVANTVLSYYDVWKDNGVEPEISLTEEVLPIEGNELAVKRILQNITKNAMLHGYKKISLRLSRTDNDTAEIAISNPVEHPEEIRIDRVFEQFYTVDSAHRQSSSGLGLAIAKEYTERLGGTIAADLSDGIFTVSIKLPTVR